MRREAGIKGQSLEIMKYVLFFGDGIPRGSALRSLFGMAGWNFFFRKSTVWYDPV